MYRPEIKICDCTIRDGGLMNNWEFSKEFVKEVFQGLVDAGVDYAELGYRADKKQFDPAKSGLWRFCDESDLRDVAFECGTKISVMCDVGRTDYATILPKHESIVGMYRVATYAKDIDKAIHLGNHIKNLGYEVCINIMAASHVLEPDMDEALGQLAQTNFDAIYLVDSFGYFYSEQIHYLAEKYLQALPGKQVGIHCHNNQQLAFANTIEGIIKGINYVDGSIYGMGRAAGNCTTELLLGFLKNPKYNVRPVLALIEKHFLRMREELRWGYEPPHMIVGMLNKHPKASLKFMDDFVAGKPTDLVAFYNECVDMEDID
ncbi:MAG: aldolase catalytic domain-containing protein [Candidatus Hydrogenedentes bacterium]|nr:aldolase catalytic domain-containing protein [Candidatus Hydrogenedentota bacterium]